MEYIDFTLTIFRILFQNHWSNFNKTWYIASFSEGTLYMLFKSCTFPQKEIKIHWQLFKIFLETTEKKIYQGASAAQVNNVAQGTFVMLCFLIILYHYYFHYLFGYSKNNSPSWCLVIVCGLIDKGPFYTQNFQQIMTQMIISMTCFKVSLYVLISVIQRKLD